MWLDEKHAGPRIEPQGHCVEFLDGTLTLTVPLSPEKLEFSSRDSHQLNVLKTGLVSLRGRREVLLLVTVYFILRKGSSGVGHQARVLT